MKTTNWHGINIAKEVSFLEYGLLVRWDRSNRIYQCLVRIAKDKWILANISIDEMEAVLFENWFDIDRFQNFTKVPISSWITLDFEKKLYDMIRFVGTEGVFGTQVVRFSTREACKISRIDFSPEYALLSEA